MLQDRSRLTRIAGSLLCLLGTVVLFGWLVGSQVLVRLLPGSVAMSINTAFMFLTAGACLLLAASGRCDQRLFRGGTWLIITLASAILMEHVFDVDLAIDLAAVHDSLGDGHTKPGRTAPNACLGFLLAGVALKFAGRSTRHAARIGVALAVCVFLIGLSAFLGYTLKLDAMYQLASYNRMAAFTALGMTLLGIGLGTLPAMAQVLRAHERRDDAQRITKLAALMLMVFAIATGLISFAVLRDSFEKSAADNHMNTAKSTAFSISTSLSQVGLLSSSVASRPMMTASLLRLDGKPDDRAALAALEQASKAFSDLGFSGARIVNAAGATLYARGSMTSDTGAMSVPFGNQPAATSLRWRDGFFLRSEHGLAADGRLVATIVTEQRLGTLDALLGEARQASQSTDILLCARQERDVLCFPSRFYTAGLKLPLYGRDGAPAFPISHALLGKTGSASIKDARGVVVLAGYAPLPHHELGIVVKTDARELYLPLRNKLHVLIIWALVFVGIGALLLRRWLQPLIAQIVEERQRIKAILDNSNDAFIGIGPDGRVTDWNKQAEKTLGLSAAEAIGNDLARLIIPPEQRAAHNAGFKRFLATGTGPVINSRIEVSAMHASGAAIPVELSVTAMRIGEQYGASAFLRDLSERKAAEARAREHALALEEVRIALNQSQKLEAVGKLTGGVAHDFNNVLQVIKGSLELLRHENEDAYRIIRRVDTAAGAVQRGAKLAAQLLAFARKQPLQPVATGLGRVVRSMEDMLQRALGDAVELDIVDNDDLWTSLVDPHQLEHVILNLAINARDAMDGEGKLTIEVSNTLLDDGATRFAPELNPGQYVMLAITDTGTGMAPATMERVFEPFFSTKPEGQGTGLGLSMTYGFVKQSGGHIQIASALGQGSTFRIYLPRSFEQEQHAAPAAATAVEGGCETILVVEDDLAVQGTAVELLTGLGYRVLKADNASMALGIVEAGERIDLLFTDVVMPGELRSPELARRAALLLPGLKVLFTSGYTQDAIVHGGRLDPGVHLLSKPYGREQLGRKVRAVLEADAPSGPVTAGLRVAFVEDNDDFRLLGTELVMAMGHHVESFGSAEDAIAAVLGGRFDVLLTDVGLPGMSGMELAQAVYAARPDVRVILATGYGDTLANRPAFPFQILPKPFTIEQLQAALERPVQRPRPA